MGGVVIDTERCNRCGLCVHVCPHRLLKEDEGQLSVDQADCMECGHCQSVCPSGAIQLDTITAHLDFSTFAEKTDAIQPGKYDCGELVQFMRSRRSCRNYSEQNVPLDLLEDLVKAGITAPSGTNAQPWNFIILPEREDVEVLGGLTADFYRNLNRQAANPLYRFAAWLLAGDALGKYYREHYSSVAQALKEWDENGCDRLFHGAVSAILITGNRDASCPAEDALLATQNILLAAHAMGLGTCLIGFVVEAMRRSAIMRRAMAVPDNEEIYSVIAVGFPAVRYTRVAGRRPVRPRVLHLCGSKKSEEEP